MTNPMYMGELDDTPAFIQTDETKVKYGRNLCVFLATMIIIIIIYLFFFSLQRFTNPVYESMYADSSEPTLLSGNSIIDISGNNIETISSSVYEEKTGLLQRDDIQLNDLL